MSSWQLLVKTCDLLPFTPNFDQRPFGRPKKSLDLDIPSTRLPVIATPPPVASARATGSWTKLAGTLPRASGSLPRVPALQPQRASPSVARTLTSDRPQTSEQKELRFPSQAHHMIHGQHEWWSPLHHSLNFGEPRPSLTANRCVLNWRPRKLWISCWFPLKPTKNKSPPKSEGIPVSNQPEAPAEKDTFKATKKSTTHPPTHPKKKHPPTPKKKNEAKMNIERLLRV